MGFHCNSKTTRKSRRRPFVREKSRSLAFYVSRAALLLLSLYLSTLIYLGAKKIWTTHGATKYYPLSRRFATELPCLREERAAEVASNVRPLGKRPSRESVEGFRDGKLRAAAVSLFRTPGNECEADKLVTWLKEVRAAWPWLQKYDHIILHESDYTDCQAHFDVFNAQSRGGGEFGKVRCLNVNTIDTAFVFPPSTGENGFKESYMYPLETRNVGYMHMCRLFSILLFPFLETELGYDYILRIDDDNVPLTRNEDLFELLHRQDAVYGYPAELAEWHKETAQTFGLWLVHNLFNGPTPSGSSSTFGRHVHPRYYRNETAVYHLPQKIFFTNLFITRVSFWTQDHIQEFLGLIDGSGNIYKHRWGDAPIHHVVLSLFADSCSVLSLCDVAYKHGSTGHMIEKCVLKRVEKHAWDEDLNPECRDKGRKESVQEREEKTKMVTKEARVKGKTMVPRCTSPRTGGDFVTNGKATSFFPAAVGEKGETGQCFMHGFTVLESRECLENKWVVFAGGQNAFNAYASLIHTLAPTFFSSSEQRQGMWGLDGDSTRDFVIQYGQAYDVVINQSGQVLYFNQTSLDFDEGRLERVWSPYMYEKHESTPQKGNPHGTTRFTTLQKHQYSELFEHAPPPPGNQTEIRGAGYTRITILVSHYWLNALDTLWLAGQTGAWKDSGLVFHAQIPSFEMDSMCMEDVDYCWSSKDPKQEKIEKRKAATVQEYGAFLSTAKLVCQRPGAECFVMSGSPPDAKYSALLSDGFAAAGLSGHESVHYVDLSEMARSVPNELWKGYVMSQFLSIWIMQMVLNTICGNVEAHGAPHMLTFHESCRGSPILLDDYTQCDPIAVKHKRKWPLLPRWTTTTFKNSKCKSIQDDCVFQANS